MGDKIARDAYRMTRTVALEGGVHLLNAMVDGGLLILANRTREKIKPSDMGRSREVLISEIEERIGAEVETLPGWNEVEKLRSDANALKHRVGLTFGPGTETPLSIKTDVSVTQDDLMKGLMSVRQWLLEIDRRMPRKS